eukprot:GHVT01101480.1.p1 GENE.GHVT01101480.1~~GHVT01101480.1.p1  ORF type:complete len:108 (-),score=10.32 GHVT01101480.1:271-594(-)
MPNVTNAVNTFSSTPCRAMCKIVILEALNTIAFGGVAIGNMKANWKLRAAGSPNNRGLTLSASARLRIIGIITFAVAVLLVNSVTNEQKKMMHKINSGVGSCPSPKR